MLQFLQTSLGLTPVRVGEDGGRRQVKGVKAPLREPNLSSLACMDLSAFQQQLVASRRVLVLVGAGLSAASGLPAFREPAGRALWRDMDMADLATPEAFDVDPQLVWQFYASRRREALAATPNAGHFALARLSQLWGAQRCLTLTQNVDALSEAAGHPPDALVHMHGELFVVRCTDRRCQFRTQNFDPALGETAVPACPRCAAPLRPGVTWFGESLPYAAIVRATAAVESGDIDLVLCVGMSAEVWPAAGYIDEVVLRGGRVAVFNPDSDASRSGAWFFRGSADDMLPLALQPVIGQLDGESSELSELSECE